MPKNALFLLRNRKNCRALGALSPELEEFLATRLLAAFLFTTLIENLILCSSAEAEIILNLFLNF